MSLLKDIFIVLWFFLPAGLANMFPIFVAHTPGLRKLEYPMDFYWSFRDRRILGENKTIRGLLTGIITAIIMVFLQKIGYAHSEFLRSILPMNYSLFNPFVLGFLFGFGALFGDALKSFFKRQLNIDSGKPWLFFDQIDYILGGILFTYFYHPLSFFDYVILVVIWFVLHIASTICGYFLGLKKSPL
jgi:CDP-2,3-bis-(O-geranylgeranyl)-sn-glycerol synthase